MYTSNPHCLPVGDAVGLSVICAVGSKVGISVVGLIIVNGDGVGALVVGGRVGEMVGRMEGNAVGFGEG